MGPLQLVGLGQQLDQGFDCGQSLRLGVQKQTLILQRKSETLGVVVVVDTG